MRSATITGLDVKAERVRAGLKQVELAKLVGVGQTEISRIEDSQRPEPRLRAVLAIIAAYVEKGNGRG